MKNKKVSIIIPARNEEEFIQKTLESLKNTGNFCSEIIVVVNGSNDKTFEVSRFYTNKVLNFRKAIGPSAARNEGAKIASGDILVFLDADTEIGSGVLPKIIENFNSNIIGVCSADIEKGKTDKRLRAKVFFEFRNFIHKTNIYRGSIALIFCGRELFLKIGGFNESMWVGELGDFIKKAIKAEAKYKFMSDCYIVTSLRRYEKEWGYVRMFLFWIRWRTLSLFRAEEKLSKSYFKIEK